MPYTSWQPRARRSYKNQPSTTNEENEAKQMTIPRKIRCTEKYDDKPAPISETGDSNTTQVYDIPHA
jgi:hypothetical protein